MILRMSCGSLRGCHAPKQPAFDIHSHKLAAYVLSMPRSDSCEAEAAARFARPLPRLSGACQSLVRQASAGHPGMRRGYGLWDRDHSPPMTPAQAGVHLGTSTHAHEAASGDGYLPAQVSSELGFCAPYPSENSPPHTKHLLSQEPDQVPFWLWVAGSGWCGSERRSDARLGRSGQGEPRKLGWESASSGRTGEIPG